MAQKMPFNFLWCYEPEDDEEAEDCGCLLLGTPETVTPLHIDISNNLADKTITFNSIEGVTEADTTNYHFKLAFSAGILVNPEQIAVEGTNWSLYQDDDHLYLLWIGEEISLNYEGATEVILTGVAAQSATRSTTTNVTITWKFKQGTMDIINISRIPGQNNEYANTTTLELEMIKTSGKSNIPLYVGFVGSNKVFNVKDETSDLQLRITNTNLPNIKDTDITFQYDSNVANCSQLVIVLEVGDATNVPWALGTEDNIKDVGISIVGNQWQPKGDPEEIKVGDVTKALQWTFTPKSADVVLAAQETLLINLENIVTTHPTGEANLYLRYQYIDGYKDGQFICQIEKAPLIFDHKVRVGTSKELDGLLTVKNGISLDSPGEIQHTGPFIFRSDVDNTNDDSSVKFFKKDESQPLMELTSSGNLGIGTTEAPTGEIKLHIYSDGTQGNGNADLVLQRKNGNILKLKAQDKQSRITFSDNLLLEKGDQGDTKLAINPNGNVGIGTNSPSAKLEVSGKSKSSELEVTDKAIFDGNVGIGTDSPSAKLDVSGKSKSSELEVTGKAIFNSNVGIGTTSPSAKLDVSGETKTKGINIVNGKIRINGGPVMKYERFYSNNSGWTSYQCSEWFAAVVGFYFKSEDGNRHNVGGVTAEFYENKNSDNIDYWCLRVYLDDGEYDNRHYVDALFIRKELFD
ncbi:hypothetical protein [Cyanothece sp. BG0011]|uniref:hypothetical protein n=1 Tax=Cyanothece sp. BG0011 TaxID=2082950 RepID=UPI000D1E9119|nr:hypothetical protein [Cyanothece sp. BG0011]